MLPYQDWSLHQLELVLTSLKRNKSKDPYGLINEIFRPEVIGNDLKYALLKFFNKIKANIIIPELLQLVNIITIYKGKGSRRELDNERGIFIVNKFKRRYL